MEINNKWGLVHGHPGALSTQLLLNATLGDLGTPLPLGAQEHPLGWAQPPQGAPAASFFSPVGLILQSSPSPPSPSELLSL